MLSDDVVIAQELPIDAPLTPIEVGTDAGAPAAESLVNNDVPAARPGIFRRVGRGIYRATTWCFGVLSLVLALAVISWVPILQFASLGYLLEVCGRVARTGRLRDGWVGIDQGARMGGIAFGLALLLAPLVMLRMFARSARLIDTGGSRDALLTWLLVAMAVLGVIHFLSAMWRGGRVRNFLWPAPIRTLRIIREVLSHPLATYRTARDTTCAFLESLRLPYYLWLGARGALGGIIWLFIPVTILVLGRKLPALGVLGGILFGIVLLYLPFVQARFAAENRFGAMFEIRRTRRLFVRAPVMFVLALLLTLALAIPLYLTKVEMIPADAAWLACLVFVVFNWPARFITGWALARAARREHPRNFFIRQLARVGMLPIVAAYTLIVYLTQFTSWYGVVSIYAQHPFLVPVPFLAFEY
ncbi:MAG: hypothetical protein JSS27_02990 [Planctomycetes bacterium]|nr:hypothetical protein [Planctomycetota bacterium]